MLLRERVGTSQTLARALHREAELVQEPRDVMVVVAHAEALLDQVADHRAGPHTALVPNRQRSRLDHRGQLRALRIRQSRRRTRRDPREQALDAERFVPLQPPIDRSACDSGFFGKIDHPPLVQIPENRPASPPAIQIPSFLGRLDESKQLAARRRRPAARADRFSRLRSTHDHLLDDRGTLILGGSIVNTIGSRATRSCLADAPFELDYGWQLQGLYGAGGLQQVATGGNADLLAQAWQSQKNGYPAEMKHMTLLQDWDLDEDLNLYGGAANTMAAATFDFTIDGLPLLFNGEEVGNDKSGVNTHTAIDWNGPNAATFAPFYKSLLALRNANTALQQGSVAWIDNTAEAQVVSYVRSDASATFLVAINFSGATVVGTLSAPAAAGWTDVSPQGSPGGAAHAPPPAFSLKAYDFAVFRAHN